MNKFLQKAISAIAVCAAATLTAPAQINDLPRATPEETGIPSQALCTLLDSLTALPGTEMHSVVVARHGKVVAEIYPAPIKPEYKHTLYSCSKTFVGAAVGLAIDDGLLSINDNLVSFFPDKLPKTISPQLAAITIENLLTMTSGIEPDWTLRNLTTEWVASMLAKEVKDPGQTFRYDSMCSYLLSAIVQRATGMTLLDYLKTKIFEPMGITDIEWEISPEGYNTGGWGLYAQPEALAKFGILLNHSGLWDGKQLIPADWVAQMTTSKVKTNTLDYCYHTWLADYPGSSRADGALGQYILMHPATDLVVVITECTTGNGIRQRELVWETLMPVMSDTPLPPSDDTATLRHKEASYTLPTPQGNMHSDNETDMNGRQFDLEGNRLEWASIGFDFHDSTLLATITLDCGDTVRVECGYQNWLTAQTASYPIYSLRPIGRFTGITPPFHVAGSYAWDDNGTLLMRVQYADWVTAVDASVTFTSDESLTLTAQENYAKAPVTIKGTAPR